MTNARRVLALTLLAILSACGGNSSTGPQVATVIVSPSAANVGFLGSTVQFSARAEDSNGNVLSGVEILWTSTNPTVASVDPTGRATALAEGNTQIVATIDGVSGTAGFDVSPAPCTENVALDPGQHQVLPANCAIYIPGGTAGDRYRVAVLNQNNVEQSTAITNVQVQVQSVATAPALVSQVPTYLRPATARQERPAPIRLSPRQERHLRWAEGLRRETRRSHERIRMAERGLVEALGREALLPDLTAEAQASPARQTALPAKLQLRNNPGTSCAASEPFTTSLLLAQNDDMAVYQDSVLNADVSTEVTAAQAQQILDYYSAYGTTIIDQYFPGLPDIDGNGKIILYLSFNDNLDDGATAAYVWGGDLFDASGGCAASNEREMMYFNTALARALDEGFEQALETSVHEAKHIVSFWHGLGRQSRLSASQIFQPSWIEEGTAEIAGNMSSREAWAALGGPAVNEKVVGDDFLETIVNNNEELPPELLGVVIRLNRAQSYLASQPNALVIEPVGATEPISIYGSGWTFFRWLGDVYGGAASAPYADQNFFAAQVDSLTDPGWAGIEALTGKTLQQLLEEFTVGIILHESSAEPSALAYTSYNFPDAIQIWCFAADTADGGCSGNGPTGNWPWPVTTVSNDRAWAGFEDGTFSGAIGPTGVRIHEFLSSGDPGGIALQVTATQPAKVIIARLD